jgi:hypothetical protein
MPTNLNVSRARLESPAQTSAADVTTNVTVVLLCMVGLVGVLLSVLVDLPDVSGIAQFVGP